MEQRVRIEAAFPRLEARTPPSAPEDDQLLPEEQVLGREPRAWREDVGESSEQEAQEAQHSEHHARSRSRGKARRSAVRPLSWRELLRPTAILIAHRQARRIQMHLHGRQHAGNQLLPNRA
jgi:hypothetical protein